MPPADIDLETPITATVLPMVLAHHIVELLASEILNWPADVRVGMVDATTAFLGPRLAEYLSQHAPPSNVLTDPSGQGPDWASIDNAVRAWSRAWPSETDGDPNHG